MVACIFTDIQIQSCQVPIIFPPCAWSQSPRRRHHLQRTNSNTHFPDTLLQQLGKYYDDEDGWMMVMIMSMLTHYGRVTHIYVGKLTIIGSNNGLSPGRRQAIIWTNAAILLIRPLGTNFSEILITIYTFSFEKMHLKMGNGGHLVLTLMC